MGDTGEKREYADYNHAKHGDEMPFRRSQLETRFADLRRVIRCMQGMDAGEEESTLVPLYDDVPCPKFEGLIEVQKPVLVGFSFGACTVLNMYKELGASKMVCLDPWLFPLEDTERLDFGDCDTLFVDMTEARLQESREQRKLLPRASGDAVVDAVGITGGRHNNSTDFPIRMPKFLAAPGGQTQPGSNPKRLLDAQTEIVREFFGNSWGTYSERVARGEVPGVQRTVLGHARVIKKRV